MSDLPRAARPFIEFPTLLRARGFAVSPEQTTGFLSAVGLLGPKSMGDIRRAARATLAPPPERFDEFDALFMAHFAGAMRIAPQVDADSDDDTIRVQEEGGMFEPLVSEEEQDTGEVPTGSERLAEREFAPSLELDALRQLGRRAPEAMPRRRARRLRASSRGAAYNMRRMLRDAVRTDGDVMQLPRLERQTRQRAVLLLIDVSGSMKDQTDLYLRFAHTLGRAVDRIEVFTLGTRLTRITRALRLRNQDQALAAASQVVSDWDGGTRLGDALQAFLAIPRFAGFARGALTLVLSDGLERGDHAAMTDAVEKLSRRAWHLSWLSPLAVGPDFVPQTAALVSVAPFLDDIADGSSAQSICDHVLSIARENAA